MDMKWFAIAMSIMMIAMWSGIAYEAHTKSQAASACYEAHAPNCAELLK